MRFMIPAFIVFVFFVDPGMAQNCKPTGEWCAETNECCGGCCQQNVCIETYNDCRIQDDLCLDFYCPEGADCRVFHPDCQGCAPERQCVYDETNSPTNAPPNPAIKPTNDATRSVFHYFYYLLLSFFIIICTWHKCT